MVDHTTRPNTDTEMVVVENKTAIGGGLSSQPGNQQLH
jgi:hypothetical protein